MESDDEYDSTTSQIHDGYAFECCEKDCRKTFTGDDLAQIAQRAARHLNKKHERLVSHNREPIDEVEFGGHHIQGNAYEVRKYKVYITSFDVMKRIGREDGWIVLSDEPMTCDECLQLVPSEADRVEEDPDDLYSDAFVCTECAKERETEQRAENNQQLTEYCS